MLLTSQTGDMPVTPSGKTQVHSAGLIFGRVADARTKTAPSLPRTSSPHEDVQDGASASSQTRGPLSTKIADSMGQTKTQPRFTNCGVLVDRLILYFAPERCISPCQGRK